MAPERSPNRREPDRLNWLGKTVYAGGVLLRHTANLVDATADRVSKIAAESKRAFDRELDPNIEDAQVIEDNPRSDSPPEE
ncbi:MAG: hypothetical protein ABEK84_06615 [Salinibacter sp.]